MSGCRRPIARARRPRRGGGHPQVGSRESGQAAVEFLGVLLWFALLALASYGLFWAWTRYRRYE